MCREREGAEHILPRGLSRMKEKKAKEGAHGETRLQVWAEEEDSGQRLRKVKEVEKPGTTSLREDQVEVFRTDGGSSRAHRGHSSRGRQLDPSLRVWCPEVIQHGSPGSTESRTENRQR